MVEESNVNCISLLETIATNSNLEEDNYIISPIYNCILKINNPKIKKQMKHDIQGKYISWSEI